MFIYYRDELYLTKRAGASEESSVSQRSSRATQEPLRETSETSASPIWGHARHRVGT